MYQSQNSLQMKSYTLPLARPSSNFSRLSVTAAVTSERRVRIHLSAMSRSSEERSSEIVLPSKFIATKRDAFQILFAKLLAARTLES